MNFIARLRSWRILATCVVLAAIASVGLYRHADAQSVPNPAAVVKPQTYVSLDKVPRGQTFEAAVVVHIARGFHMNSNKPLEDYLIPTTLTANPPKGIKVLDTIYPPGEMKTFTFSPKKPLNVYTDSVTLRLKMAAEASAPLGAVSIPVTLRYQACNDTSCLPPVKVPVTVNLDIAAAGTTVHKAHPEIFSAPRQKS
jgi:DsbC/DsbD-like thiol-disulfide interchange protein